MDKVSLDEVKTLITLLRNRDYVGLSQHPASTFKVVQKRLPEQAELADSLVGHAVYNLIRDAIELMKPPLPEQLTKRDWRQYILLQEHVINARAWGLVAPRLGLARTAFYGVRNDAIESLVSILNALEAEARRELPRVKHNLPRPPYHYWIQRSVDGEDLVDKIIREVNGRAWIVAIYGAGGVGKTSVAYRAAKQCSERKDFDAVVWTSAKEEYLDPPGRITRRSTIPPPPADTRPKPGASHSHSSHLEAVLTNIGRTLEVREVLTLPSVDEKRRRAVELLSTNKCLIVIDNLESLSQPAQDEVFAFLKELPEPSKAIVTSRQRHHIGETVVAVSAMGPDEATSFMQVEAATRGLRLKEGELRTVYEKTGGVAKAMQYTLGLMHIRGYSADQALAPGVEQDILLDYLFERNYAELDDLDKQVLHVMPFFSEPATTASIQAASHLAEALLRVSLGRLYQLFLVDKTHPDQDRYTLPALVPAYLRSMRSQKGHQIGGKPVSQYLAEAIEGLAIYYLELFRHINRFDRRLAFLKYEKWNILEVIAQCYSEQKWGHVIDLTHQISQPLDILGYWDERIELAERAIQAAEELDRPWESIWFQVHDIGWAHYLMGRWEQAREIYDQAYQLAKGKENYRRVKALAAGNWGILEQQAGNHQAALIKLEESLALWQEIGESWWIVVTRARLGRLMYETGNLEGARLMLTDALQEYEQIGHVGQVATVLSDLALAEFALGDQESALVHSDQSLLRARVEIEPPSPAYAYALQRRAQLDALRGDLDDARRRAQEAISLYKQLGAKGKLRIAEQFLSQFKDTQGHVKPPDIS